MRLQRDSYAPKSCAFDAANVQFLRAHLCKSHPVLQQRRLEACGDKGLTTELKMLIVNAIDETMATSIAWHKKSVRLENVLQRQAYRLAGAMVSGKTYRGIRFRW